LHSWAETASLKELAKELWEGLEIVWDQHGIQIGREC
jgi:hypothetical protein